MSFEHIGYLLFILPVFFLLVFFYLRGEKKFFLWIEDHWFLRRNLKKKLSTVFFLFGMVLFILASMDLRGPEKKIVGKTSDQKTIILIDSSASMLAEDVRPNRFRKALLLVKHFVKKAVGQQISLVVFSDGQKQIIPFTDDLDLIDARINTLNELKLERGGTGLSLAIQESIQYFKNSSDDVIGNILIFTDAEETESLSELVIPEGISIGVVGVGTAKGAPIPVRNRRGEFSGNKKYQGKLVISKLDEAFLKKLESTIKNFRYWVATSYSLPTEEIIDYFNEVFVLKTSQNEFRVRPILANYLLIPGVFFIILSCILNFGRSFASMVTILLLFVVIDVKSSEEKKKKKSERIVKLEKSLLRNELSQKGKLALASQLLKEGFSSDAESLYEETLNPKIIDSNKDHHFNYATSQLKNKNIGNGIQSFEKIIDYAESNKSDANSKLEAMSRMNLLKAFEQQQKQSKGSKGKKKEKKEDDGNKDKKSEKQDGEGEKGDQKKENKESSDGKKGEQDPKDTENGQDDEKDGKDKNEEDDKEKDKNNDSDENDEAEGKDKDKDKDKDKKDDPGEKGKKKKKLPSLLKQLINDDSQLQKKLIDAKTTERKTRERKDW